MELVYPEALELEQLQIEHDQYKRLSPVWQIIDDLLVGGYQLAEKKHLYVTRRPDEDPALYLLRLAKFCYTPVLSDAIKEFAVKVTNAPLQVEGAVGERWDAFRAKTDGKRRSERELIAKAFRIALCFGQVWAFVDKPKLPIQPLTQLQEEQLGGLPYVVLYKPSEVINWDIDETTGLVNWVKIRQIATEPNPFGRSRYRATWTIIDSQSVVKYSAYVLLGDGGRISLDPEFSTFGKVPLVTPVVRHGRGKPPVVHLALDDELWSGNHAYLKALQHLQIENSWTDTATIAGYIQRVFKPSKPAADNDPNFTFADVDEDLLKVKSSNAHLLVGDDFKFAEATGSSLQVVSEHVLSKIENQIKAIVSLGNVSAAKGVLEQSGTSKAFDYSQFHDTMKRYGSIMVGFYEEVLSHVATALGQGEASITVSGLDSFDVDTLTSLLTQAMQVQTIEANLSPLARKLWYSKIAMSMHSTVAAKEKEAMLKEFDSMNWEPPKEEEEIAA